MSYRQILQVDKHLIHRAQQFRWLDRVEPKHLDGPTLYAKHKVCSSCFKLQLEVEKLLDLEIEFASRLGVPTDYIKRYNNFSIVDLKGKRDNVPKISNINKFHQNPLDLKMPESNLQELLSPE